MTDPTQHTPETSRAPRLLITALMLPALAYLASLSRLILQEYKFTMDWVDVGIASMVFAYTSSIAFVAGSRHYAIRFTLMSLAAATALVGTEAGVRHFWPPPPSMLPRIPMRREFDSTPAAERFPGISGKVQFSVNSLGVRGPEVNLKDTDLRILCVGGSTTECLYVTDEETWPWRLQGMLSQNLGQRVFVGNAGKSGLRTPHHEAVLKHYRHVTEFDCVVVLCGTNDLATLVLGSRGLDAPARDAEDDALTPNYLHRPLYRRSAILQHLSLLSLF